MTRTKRVYYVEWFVGVLSPKSSYTTEDAVEAAEIVAKKQAEGCGVRLRYEDVPVKPSSTYRVDWIDASGAPHSETKTCREVAADCVKGLIRDQFATAVSFTVLEPCQRPRSPGWQCIRPHRHDGPCAAVPV